MDKRCSNGDASRLAGHFTKPYRQDAVVAAARTLAEPFVLYEVTTACGLPAHIVHNCLCRLVRKGVFVRFKVAKTVTGYTGGRIGKLRAIPGGRTIHVYAYRFVDRRP